MTVTMDQWYFLAAGVLIGLCLGAVVFYFMRLPGKKQITKIKEWMLFAVTEAERQLGGGTGLRKLKQVYDGFEKRFPKAAKVVSYDTFVKWVDEALTEMREVLEMEESTE